MGLVAFRRKGNAGNAAFLAYSCYSRIRFLFALGLCSSYTLLMCQYAENTGTVFKYHRVWCRKYPRPALVKPVDQRLKALLQQETKELKITIHSLPIMPDHVDLVVEADPTRCMAEMVHRLKGSTSRVLRTEFVSLRSYLPTLGSRSYYAGRVGTATAAVVRQHIEGQKRR